MSTAWWRRGWSSHGAAGRTACEFVLTDEGHEAIDRLQAARRAGLTELLDGWDPDAHPEIGDMVRRLAHELLADDEKLLADASSVG